MCLLTGSFVHKVFLLELFVYISRKLPAMRKSIILISFLYIFCITSNARNSYTRPTGLHTIENGSIYSIYQDELGALWMNTNYGICRYNGHSLEFVHDPLPISTIIGNGSIRQEFNRRRTIHILYPCRIMYITVQCKIPCSPQTYATRNKHIKECISCRRRFLMDWNRTEPIYL